MSDAVHARVLCCSVVSDSVHSWTVAVVPLSMGILRLQEWVAKLSSRVFPTQGIEPASASPALAGAFFTAEPPMTSQTLIGHSSLLC